MATVISSAMVMRPTLEGPCQIIEITEALYPTTFQVVYNICGPGVSMPIKQIKLEINQHDDMRYFVDMVTSEGDPLLVDDFRELIFSIAPNITSASSTQKRLTDGTLNKSGPSQVYFDIDYLESGAMSAGSKFCEFRGITGGDIHQTMAQGSFTVIDTQIGDYS